MDEQAHAGLQQHFAFKCRVITQLSWRCHPAATEASASQAAHEAALAELGEAVAAGEARAVTLQARLSAEAAERDDALAALRADVKAQRQHGAELQAALGAPWLLESQGTLNPKVLEPKTRWWRCARTSTRSATARPSWKRPWVRRGF